MPAVGGNHRKWPGVAESFRELGPGKPGETDNTNPPIETKSSIPEGLEAKEKQPLAWLNLHGASTGKKRGPRCRAFHEHLQALSLDFSPVTILKSERKP